MALLAEAQAQAQAQAQAHTQSQSPSPKVQAQARTQAQAQAQAQISIPSLQILRMASKMTPNTVFICVLNMLNLRVLAHAVWARSGDKDLDLGIRIEMASQHDLQGIYRSQI